MQPPAGDRGSRATMILERRPVASEIHSANLCFETACAIQTDLQVRGVSARSDSDTPPTTHQLGLYRDNFTVLPSAKSRASVLQNMSYSSCGRSQGFSSVSATRVVGDCCARSGRRVQYSIQHRRNCICPAARTEPCEGMTSLLQA